MKWLKKYGYGAWLGLAVGILHISVISWQWYFIILPTVWLVEWKAGGDK